MNIFIDNITLDETNEEFKSALEFVSHTDKTVYLTGKAGTGKTTFLKYLRETTSKKTIILAPTGVASINAGGQTINSFFQLPFGPFVLNDKRLSLRKKLGETDDTSIFSTFKYREDKKNIIEQLELLIIDEISMVRCDTLDVIDKILRVFRKKPYLPFGGVQVLLIGDTFQLPPIAKFEHWEILKHHYESPFFFSSKVFIENKPVYIEFKKIYRQKEQEFIDLLNKIRTNQINDIELNELNKKYNPTFTSSNSDNHIILSTTNNEVNRTNATKLDELSAETKIFQGELTGVFPKDSKGDFVLPTEQNLQLKVGAQIMILRNDLGEYKRYFNGKIGKIESLKENRIIVQFTDESKVQIEKAIWNNIQYTWNKETEKIEETIVGTFMQYPLRLAWAITVHKSQGLTFENVYADLGSAFEDGQVYVALSRCTSLNGLVLKSKISRDRITTNIKVLEFAKTETPHTLIVEELTSGKADYYYRKVRENLKILNFSEAYNNFTKAIKFRNDIESETLKKFFIVTASKLGSNKLKLEVLQQDYERIIDENENYKISLLDIEKENSNLKRKLEEQNGKIEILLANKNEPITDSDKTNQLEIKINLLETSNHDLILENIENKNIVKNLIQTSKNRDVAEFISKNFLYEKSLRGFEARKEWFDNLNEKWRNDLGLYNVKYYNELPNILNDKIELSINAIDNIESVKYLTKLTILKLKYLHGFDEYGNSHHDMTYCNPINLKPISYLSNLEELELSSFTLEDISPLKYLHNLKRLSIAYLTRRDSGGSTSYSVFNSLQENTKLERLKIIKCSLRAIPPISNFENIIELNLAVNDISDISILRRFTNIEELNLSNNKRIENFSSLEYLSKLTSLDLCSTKFGNLEEISDLILLKILNLSNTQIVDIKSIACLNSLEYLNLSDNQIPDLSPLQNLTNLKILCLRKFVKSELKPLISLFNLSDLFLDGNEIIDIESLCKMKQLKILSLLNCKLSEEEQNNIMSSLPDCKITFKNVYLPY